MNEPSGAWREHVRRTATLIIGSVVLLLILASSTLYERIRALIDGAAPFLAEHERAGVIVFLLLSALSAMLAFFSTAVVVPVAIAAWGRVVTVLLLWLGWWLGAVASYAIGRYVGRPAVRWLIPDERLQSFERYANRTLSFPRLLLLQLAIPSEIPGYVLGSLQYSGLRYLGGVAIVELPFAIGAVCLGDRFLERDYVLLAAAAIAGIATTFAAGWLVHRSHPSPRERDVSGRVTA